MRMLRPICSCALLLVCACLGSGCVLTAETVLLGTRPGPPGRDVLEKMNGAWTDGRRVVLAFKIELQTGEQAWGDRSWWKRSPPANYWVSIPLERPSPSSGAPREELAESASELDGEETIWSSLDVATIRVPRDRLRRGFPLETAIAGLIPVPIVDLERFRDATSKTLLRHASRRPYTLYVDRSDERGARARDHAVRFHLTRRSPGAVPVTAHRMELEPDRLPPAPEYLLLLPLAMVGDSIVLSIYLLNPLTYIMIPINLAVTMS